MDTVKPLVKSWEDMLNLYRNDNEEAKLILRRFDEVLSFYSLLNHLRNKIAQFLRRD